MAIQRKSYRKPIIKEGITSTKEIPDGLKAIKVIILNRLKMIRKMTNKFATHKIVFGILYFTSINLYQLQNEKGLQKNRIKPVSTILCYLI